jgi:hypothetical protein
MNKSKKTFKESIKNSGKYLREVSVVVIGVAITLSIGIWINNRSIKNDVALSLNAIKIELEKNADAFEWCANRLHKSTRYAYYVQSHDEKSISRDSIEYYAMSSNDGIGWGEINTPPIFINNAFEMLKTSGIMRYITDRELLETIWDAYRYMEYSQDFLDNAYKMKMEFRINELMAGTDIIPNRIFYTLETSYWMEWQCRQVSEKLREVLLEWK